MNKDEKERLLDLFKSKDKENVSIAYQIMKGKEMTDLEIFAFCHKYGIIGKYDIDSLAFLAMQIVSPFIDRSIHTAIDMHSVFARTTIEINSYNYPPDYKEEGLEENLYKFLSLDSKKIDC